MKDFITWLIVPMLVLAIGITCMVLVIPTKRAPPAPVPAAAPPSTTPTCPVNRHAEALSVFWFSGVSLLRGEDLAFVTEAVAEAVAFDPELAEMWRGTVRGELPDGLFLMLLQARAWHGQCPYR